MNFGSRKISLFKVAGVQVDIDYSWLAIFALVLWSLSAGYFPQTIRATILRFLGDGATGNRAVLWLGVSHQNCRAVGNGFGEKMNRITLFIFGGMAHLSGEPRAPAMRSKSRASGR